MDWDDWLILIVAIGALGCATSGTGTEGDEEAAASDESDEEIAVPLQSKDAPAGGYSCRHYDPVRNVVYLGDEFEEELEENAPKYRRKYFEALMHGIHQFRDWRRKIEDWREDHGDDGMSRADIVEEIQHERMRESGSVEQYVRFRLGEEESAKRAAWNAANHHRELEFALEPIEEAELTDEEIEYHRGATREHVWMVRQDHPDLFE